MSSTLSKFDTIIDTLLSTLKRFPLASLSAFLFTIILMVLANNHYHTPTPNEIVASKIAFVSTLAFVLFTALRLLSYRNIFYLIGIILIVGYYYILPSNIDHASKYIFTRHLLLILAFLFMIIWAPFITKKSDNPTFWQWTQSILFSIITAVFFGLVVWVSSAGAMYALKTLFHFDIDSIRYEQVALFCFGLVSTLYFLSQIPKNPLSLEVRPYSKVKRTFAKLILGTISVVYFVILYSYSAKILLTHTWPSGTVSWIIVAFTLVVIVGFLFWTPFLNKKSTILQRFIWLAIFLQTIMLGVALYMRVMEYGITYNRYLIGIYGIWLLLMSLYFILFGKAQQKWLFVFASVLIVVSQFGSYSAQNITKKSQESRLAKLIEEAQPISEKTDMKTKYQISDVIAYINRNYGTKSFEKTLPKIYEKFNKNFKKEQEIKEDGTNNYFYDFPSFATYKLGFKFVNRWDWMNYKNKNKHPEKLEHYFYAKRDNKAIDITGYNYLLSYNTYNRVSKERNSLNIELKKKLLIVKQGKRPLSHFKLNKFFEKLSKSHTSEEDINRIELTFEAEDNITKVKILFYNFILNGENEIRNANCQALIKMKKRE